MSRRTERVSSQIRRIVGQLLLARFADPRVDPARTSVTGVEVSDDFLTATVYVSVMGTEADQRKTIQALRHAAGYFQERLGKQLTLRHTPVLNFEPDEKFKKTLETLLIIEEVSEEIRRKDQAAAEARDEDETGQADEEEVD